MKQYFKKALIAARARFQLPLALLAGLWLVPAPSVVSAPADPSAKPLVVTTIRPLTLIVRELTGEEADVVELLAAGQDPHHLSLSPSQRRLLGRADPLVWICPGLEAFLAKPVASLDRRAVVTWLPGDLGHGGEQAGEGVHGDPHIWLDPEATGHFARALAARLAERHPSMAAGIAARLANFEVRLQAADRALAARMAPLQTARFVAEHAAYGPFVERYGLRAAGSLSDPSGVALGARNLLALHERDDLACIAVERAPGSRLARQLAARMGVPLVVIDPLGLGVALEEGYVGLLMALGDGFEDCLASAQ